MKNNNLIACLIILTLLCSCRSDEFSSGLRNGKYFGTKPPGEIPELFAPGIFSTEANEFNAVFTKDGNKVYFTGRGETGQDIMVIEKLNGVWQERRPASFSDSHRDVDPFITHDGDKLFFSSNRPVEGNDPQDDCDFWYVEKLPSGEWGEAKHLENPCTAGKHDFYYTSSRGGTIYYSIFGDDGNGDLYTIPSTPGDSISYKLEYPINTEHNEHDPFIAPDESFLIFTSDRPGGYGSADLYICFAQTDGTWSPPINMGDKINSEKYDYCAILSPDEKYFFFSSSRSGNGDVYWVDASIIHSMNNKEEN